MTDFQKMDALQTALSKIEPDEKNQIQLLRSLADYQTNKLTNSALFLNIANLLNPNK